MFYYRQPMSFILLGSPSAFIPLNENHFLISGISSIINKYKIENI